MPITFSVNLQAPFFQSTKPPYDPVESANYPLTNSTWLPNLNLANYVRKHGTTFQASGLQAVYLRNAYTSGPYAVLSVVSGTP